MPTRNLWPGRAAGSAQGHQPAIRTLSTPTPIPGQASVASRARTASAALHSGQVIQATFESPVMSCAEASGIPHAVFQEVASGSSGGSQWASTWGSSVTGRLQGLHGQRCPAGFARHLVRFGAAGNPIEVCEALRVGRRPAQHTDPDLPRTLCCAGHWVEGQPVHRGQVLRHARCLGLLPHALDRHGQVFITPGEWTAHGRPGHHCRVSMTRWFPVGARTTEERVCGASHRSGKPSPTVTCPNTSFPRIPSESVDPHGVFCERCGDCLVCYAEDPCLDGGDHT